MPHTIDASQNNKNNSVSQDNTMSSKYNGYGQEDIFQEKKVHMMLLMVNVSVYKAYIAHIQNATDPVGARHKRLFERLAIMYCDVFSFVFENKPWDPTIMTPQNEISSAYVAAVTFCNNAFQCSSGINSVASLQQPTYEYCIDGGMVAETKIVQKSTTTSK
eukprot:9461904-Ditylum_brightwellii.AAC.1